MKIIHIFFHIKKSFLLFALFIISGSLFSQEIIKVQAVSAVDFLSSLGAVSSISRSGETLDRSIECIRYTGLRWIRGGYEDNAPVQDFINLYRETGALTCYGLLSGKSDLDRLLYDARQIAKAGIYYHWKDLMNRITGGITYQGEKGGRDSSMQIMSVITIILPILHGRDYTTTRHGCVPFTEKNVRSTGFTVTMV